MDPSTVSTSGPISTPGNIAEEVEPVPVITNAPVPFDIATEFSDRVTVRVADVAAIAATAELPGEVAGPAVAITLEITNGSAAAIGLDGVTADLTDGSGNPALPMSTDPAQPFFGPLAPGAQQVGTFVFTTPTEAREDMSLAISYSTGAPTVLFVGSLPRS